MPSRGPTQAMASVLSQTLMSLQSYELKLSDGKLEVIETGPRPPYSIRQMGIYLVVDTEMGLVLLWDKGTSIFLRLSPEFKVRPRPTPGAAGDADAGKGETETPKQTERDKQRDTGRDREREKKHRREAPRDGQTERGRGCQHEALGHVWVPQLLEGQPQTGGLLPKAGRRATEVHRGCGPPSLLQAPWPQEPLHPRPWSPRPHTVFVAWTLVP